MFQLTQIKLLSLIAALLLSILGVVTYEHHQAEAKRQAEQQAQEQFRRNLLRESKDPRNHLDWSGMSKFLREH